MEGRYEWQIADLDFGFGFNSAIWGLSSMPEFVKNLMSQAGVPHKKPCLIASASERSVI